MSTTAIGKSDRLLKKALQYVSDYWLPVNRQLAEKIREGVETGSYDTDRSLLIKDLSCDLGLFFGCIRELRVILSRGGADTECENDLTVMIQAVDIEILKEALSTVTESPSVHILSEGEDAQVSRLLEAILSSSTAHTLAPGYGVSPGAAASLAALRQLGYALIAWNYPSVYQDALNAARDNQTESIDVILSRTLGFTPLLLASRLAHSWGLPAELSNAALVPTLPMYEDAHIVSATTGTLSTICRVSESLARAQFENYYPDARNEWEAAKKEVERKLGPQGIEKIRERCAAVSRVFLSTSPDIFRPGLLLDEQTQFAANESLSNKVRNPYAALCDSALRKKLTQLYEMMPNNKASVSALKFLMRDVIPAARFSGGCVYTVDPTLCALVPQLEVGPMELRTSGPVEYLTEHSEDDPVPLAFLTTEGCKPIVAEHNREGMGCITSAFGRSQRLGVLYLELPLVDFKGQNKQLLLHFQALTHALVDCLGL